MKKLLIGLGALVVILIAAAVILPFVIPVEAVTGRLVAAVKSSTGRDLRLGGPVKLSLLPRLEIEAGDVSFANAQGAHDPDMLRLKKLEVTLRLLPLLGGSVELGRFVLTEPQLFLEIDKAGTPNWAFTPAAPAASRPGAPAGQAPPAKTAGRSMLSGLSLGDVRLVNGAVSYRDDRSGKAETVQAIDTSLSLPDLDHPFEAEGSATWHGQKISVSVRAAKPGALLSGGDSPVQVKLSGNPLSTAFDGSVTGLPPTKLGGTIDLAVPSVRGLAEWAGSPLPAGPGLQKLAIAGRVEMEGPKVAFTDATIALDALSAKGSIGVMTGGPRPALTGTLAVDDLDVNPYLPPEQTASSGAAPGGAGGARGPAAAGGKAAQGWSDAPIDLSPLKLADGDFNLSAGAIHYRKIEVGQSALDLHLKAGKFSANLSRVALYKGAGQGTLSVDGGGAVPALAMNFDLKGVAVGPLLAATAGSDRLDGTGNVNFTVAGSGRSQRAIVSALNGKGAFELANGELKGVNLIALAENVTKPLTGANVANETSFGSLTGTFTITNGVLKNDDLQLKSGVVPITGAGTVNLPERSVNYRVTVSLAGAIGVPVVVSGPWDDLSYRPDVAGALQGVVQSPQNVLKGLGGKTGVGSPGNLLKNLNPFGK